MKIKKQYAKKEDVPKGLEALYEEKGGAWVRRAEFDTLEDEGAGGGGDPDPDAAAAKAKLAEFRESNRRLAEENQQIKTEFGLLRKQWDGISPESIKLAQKMIAEVAEKEEQELLKAGKLKEVVERRLTAAIGDTKQQLAAKEEAYKKLEQKHQALSSRWAKQLARQQIKALVAKRGMQFQPGAEEDADLVLERDWQLDENEQLVPRDGLLGEDGSKIKPDAYVEKHLIGARPHFFKPAQGGGADGNDGGGGGGGRNGAKVVVDGNDPMAMGKNLDAMSKGNVIVRH